MQRITLANKFKIGCDPEFALIGSDGLAVAGNVNRLIKASPPIQVGWDGSDTLGELRPTAAYSSYTLCERLRKLIKSEKMTELEKTYKFRGGAVVTGMTPICDCGRPDCPDNNRTTASRATCQLSIGGHIHFDAKTTVAWQPGLNGACIPWNELQVAKRLHAMGRALEYLEILPAAECALRRRRYGGPFDIRGGGSEKTVEFRELCSWLFHPKVAFLVLTLAKLIALDPAGAATFFKMDGKTEFSELSGFVSCYTQKDDDARRLSETLLSKGLPALKADPTAHFAPKWKAWKPAASEALEEAA